MVAFVRLFLLAVFFLSVTANPRDPRFNDEELKELGKIFKKNLEPDGIPCWVKKELKKTGNMEPLLIHFREKSVIIDDKKMGRLYGMQSQRSLVEPQIVELKKYKDRVWVQRGQKPGNAHLCKDDGSEGVSKGRSGPSPVSRGRSGPSPVSRTRSGPSRTSSRSRSGPSPVSKGRSGPSSTSSRSRRGPSPVSKGRSGPSSTSSRSRSGPSPVSRSRSGPSPVSKGRSGPSSSSSRSRSGPSPVSRSRSGQSSTSSRSRSGPSSISTRSRSGPSPVSRSRSRTSSRSRSGPSSTSSRSRSGPSPVSRSRSGPSPVSRSRSGPSSTSSRSRSGPGSTGSKERNRPGSSEEKLRPEEVDVMIKSIEEAWSDDGQKLSEWAKKPLATGKVKDFCKLVVVFDRKPMTPKILARIKSSRTIREPIKKQFESCPMGSEEASQPSSRLGGGRSTGKREPTRTSSANRRPTSSSRTSTLRRSRSRTGGSRTGSSRPRTSGTGRSNSGERNCQQTIIARGKGHPLGRIHQINLKACFHSTPPFDDIRSGDYPRFLQWMKDNKVKIKKKTFGFMKQKNSLPKEVIETMDSYCCGDPNECA